MKNEAKIFHKVKKTKTSLSKKKILIIKDNKSNYGNLRQSPELKDNDNENFIKSKSFNRFKVNKNIKKSLIKLPILKKNIYVNNDRETNNSKIIKKNFLKNNSLKKININTNSISNIYSKDQNSKKKLSKYHSTYNLKLSQNYEKSKKININTTNGNIGKFRHLDRKKLKGNKNKIINKKGFKLFNTTKIINNFNNQINENKNKEIYTLSNDNENNNNSKKLDVFYEIEEKVSKIQNCFRNHLKEEENEIKKNENNNIIDIISDISLSEEELNFSDEESFNNNIDFSLDEEEL